MSEHFGAKLSFLGGVLVIDNVKYLWEHSDEVAASSFKMKKTYLKILICKQWALFTYESPIKSEELHNINML